LKRLEGVFVPMVLPLDAASAVDSKALSRLVEHLLAGGVNGLWVNGTTGEFHALGVRERARVVAEVAQIAAGRCPVIAQVGDTATLRTIAHAEAAIESGATHLAVLPPYYMVYSQSEIDRHFRAVSSAIARPFYLYNFPSLTKVAIDTRTTIGLTRDGVAVGMKDSSGDLEYHRRTIAAAREQGLEFACFQGTSTLVAASLLTGSAGLVCAVANLLPATCAALFRQARTGAWSELRATQERINRLVDALAACLSERSGRGGVVAAMKWLLVECGVLGTATVFEPLAPLSSKEQDALRDSVLPLVLGELRAGRCA